MKITLSQFGKNAEIKNQIKKSFEESVSRFKSIRTVFESDADIKVIWNKRMRSTAGRAKGRKLEIHLNARLLTENPEELIPTFVHELAHILDVLVYGRSSGHGRNWKRIMVDLGQPVEVYHNMETKHLKAKRRKFEAKCGCRTHIIGARRVNNMEKKGVVYRCTVCGGKLEVGEELFDY